MFELPKESGALVAGGLLKDLGIDKLKKGKPSTKKSVMVHDLKKDQEFDNEDKIKDKGKK